MAGREGQEGMIATRGDKYGVPGTLSLSFPAEAAVLPSQAYATRRTRTGGRSSTSHSGSTFSSGFALPSQ